MTADCGKKNRTAKLTKICRRGSSSATAAMAEASRPATAGRRRRGLIEESRLEGCATPLHRPRPLVDPVRRGAAGPRGLDGRGQVVRPSR